VDQPVDEGPAAERLGLGGKHPVGSIRHVGLSNLSWLTEMHLYVQGVLPVGGEVLCIRKLHVFLTAVGSQQHTDHHTVAALVVITTRTAAETTPHQGRALLSLRDVPVP
jgi:hypothetical protein